MRIIPLTLLGVLVLALSLLSGCGFTSQGDAARAAVKQYGAQAMDEALVNNEWFMCYGASIGSIKRRYGASTELAAAYNAMCPSGSADLLLLEPIAEP